MKWLAVFWLAGVALAQLDSSVQRFAYKMMGETGMIEVNCPKEIIRKITSKTICFAMRYSAESTMQLWDLNMTILTDEFSVEAISPWKYDNGNYSRTYLVGAEGIVVSLSNKVGIIAQLGTSGSSGAPAPTEPTRPAYVVKPRDAATDITYVKASELRIYLGFVVEPSGKSYRISNGKTTFTVTPGSIKAYPANQSGAVDLPGSPVLYQELLWVPIRFLERFGCTINYVTPENRNANVECERFQPFTLDIQPWNP